MRQALLAPLIAVLVLVSGNVASADEAGLLLHYTFDEGKGALARDSSPHKNHGAIKGGAEFVKQVDGYALRFDGKNDLVDGGIAPGLAIDEAGTIEFWFRPEAFHGGLVAWTPSGWLMRSHRALGRSS